jgi:hypothetical protein
MSPPKQFEKPKAWEGFKPPFDPTFVPSQPTRKAEMQDRANWVASPKTILVNALLIFIAAFGMSSGEAQLLLVIFPFIAIPIALVLGAMVYGILQAIGWALKARSSLTFLNLLAACSVLSLLLGLMLSTLNMSDPVSTLFEDYVDVIAFFSVSLHIMGVGWWMSRDEKQTSSE